MRFVPHRSEQFQYTLDDIDPEYDSLSDDDDYEDDQIEKKTDVEQLVDYLTNLGLADRFHFAASLVVNNNDDWDEEKPVQVLSYTKVVKPVPITLGKEFNGMFGAIKDSITERRKKNDDAVKKLVLLEEERKRLEEERKIREAEELRLKREAEAKAKREAEEKAHKEALEQAQREAEEKAKKEAAEKAQKEAAEKARLEAEAEAKRKAEEAAKNNTVVDTRAVEKEFLTYKQTINDIKEQVVEPMKKDVELKKMVGKQKRQINPKFGQLTNSRSQLKRITESLQQLIAETKGNELAYKWILNFVAKAIVSQAEAEVAVHPQTAVSLGSLAVDLTLLFPELEYYLMARFVKKCPLVIGFTCTIDTEQGRERMGWRRSEGKWETEDRYNERLSGIAMLYSVMTRLRIMPTYLGYSPQAKHPLPISRSWTMLARIADLPMDLVTSVHYSVVGSWWDGCGSQFQQAYGRQGTKLMQLLWDNWTSAAADKKYSSAARLRLLGDDWKQGKIEKLKEMES